MKSLIAVLVLFGATAMQAQASVHRIQASYQGRSFAALTGDQDNSLSEQEKIELLQSRADQICDFFFGESSASFNPDSLAAAQGEALLITEDGELTHTSIAQTTSPGYLGATITGGADINEGLVFTELTCNR